MEGSENIEGGWIRTMAEAREKDGNEKRKTILDVAQIIMEEDTNLMRHILLQDNLITILLEYRLE